MKTGKIQYIILLLFCAVLMLGACATITKEQIAVIYNQEMVPHLSLPDPGARGNLNTKSLLYGGVYHPRRHEYSEKEIVTETVDLSPYFDWKTDWVTYLVDKGAYTDTINKWHWGFDASQAPVNGILWYPEEVDGGDTKYPLVVCMHGNHNAYDASEFGYNYLGDHLASRGYIFASIDENYLNMRTDGRENDVRAVLALEHVKTILEWNNDPDSRFYQKIDENNIAVIGHSRGGEAAVTAAIFNQLPENPDNGNIKWDYNFSIKGVVSLAPVEGQYRPAQKKAVPENIDYLLLHGSADGDVHINFGIRFLNRRLPDPGKEFYSFWIKGANHAQFNTDWSVKQDPMVTLRSDMVTEEEQQLIAKASITAFLEASFDREPGYRAFLRDYRTGRNWLPQTLYLTTYRSGEDTIIADFEEDLNGETLTHPQWAAEFSGFTMRREQVLAFDTINFIQAKTYFNKNHDSNQESTALFLEWEDQGKRSLLLRNEQGLQEAAGLSFDIAAVSLPEEVDLLDFSLVITTENETIRTTFKELYYLPRIPGTFIVPKGYSFPEMLQRVELPFHRLNTGSPDGRLKIKSIEFIFDKTSAASVLIDNILLLQESTNEI